MDAHRDDLVERRDLLRKLAVSATAGDTPVLLQAPAGYGKSVLLRQWAARDPRQFVGVRLRDATAGPGGLPASVQAALHRAGVTPPGNGTPAPADRPLVLVLDGVTGRLPPADRRALAALAGSLPRGSQVVVASRRRLEADRDLGLPRPGARCLRIDEHDLALSAREVWQVVAGLGLDCPPEVLDQLVERTEGWPAGVYLAGLAMLGAPDVAAAMAAFGGGDVRVTAYVRDVLDGVPARIRDFLLRASVLELPAGPACDAVLATSRSADRLRDAAERGLFLRPAPPDGALRFHPLVAEALRSELRERYPDEVPVLHRRASAWFARHGRPEPAVSHALAAGDTLTAAEIISRHGMAMMDAGHVAPIRSWMDALGDDAPEQYPPLGVTAAWAFSVSGDVPRALRLLLAAERGSFDGPLPDGTSCLESAVAMVRATIAPRGVERMLVDAARAVELEPAGELWRPTALFLLGNALLMTGSTAEAARVYGRSARADATRRSGSVQDALAQLSLIAAGRDDWPAAQAAAAEATQIMLSNGRQDFMPSLLTYAARARVAVHQERRGGAGEDVARALWLYREQSPLAFGWFAAQAALLLGDLLLDLGDAHQARELAAEARVHVVRLATVGVLGDRLAGLEVRIEAAALPPPAAPTAALSRSEQRVLDLLATHLPLREIGVELHLSRNTVKSHVSAIHRKLDCTTRAEAVHRGRALGLIGR